MVGPTSRPCEGPKLQGSPLALVLQPAAERDLPGVLASQLPGRFLAAQGQLRPGRQAQQACCLYV